jgi:hypothetical protein
VVPKTLKKYTCHRWLPAWSIYPNVKSLEQNGVHGKKLNPDIPRSLWEHCTISSWLCPWWEIGRWPVLAGQTPLLTEKKRNILKLHVLCGPGNVDGTATSYGLGGPGIKSRWEAGFSGVVGIFRTCPDRPWDSPSLLYTGYRVFSGDKNRPGRDADPLFFPSAVVMKG